MIAPDATLQEITQAVRDIPDFPKPGILFKDITPILSDVRLFRSVVHQIAREHLNGGVDYVVGIDARGFILGAAVALEIGAGFVPVRKKGKLPHETHEESYDLEYGSNTVAIHVDAVPAGAKVILVDDLLATGGTAAAALRLLERLDAKVLETCFLVELSFLGGRESLGGGRIRSLITY